MSFTAILAPLFVQVALTFALLFWMGALRLQSVKAGTVHVRDIALGQPNWTPQAMQVANAFHNQYQLPVLYYLLVILILVVAPATPFMVPLSWAFIATRLLHALIYVTTNNVPRRFFAYTAGLAILCLMWLILFAEIVFGL
ncbi:MAPEG family protein [soil metagenome]